jgi:hypothetical protein
MKKREAKNLTVAQYALHRRALGLTGASRQSVLKAIIAGRISQRADWLIDHALADAEWENNTRHRRDRYYGESDADWGR